MMAVVNVGWVGYETWCSPNLSRTGATTSAYTHNQCAPGVPMVWPGACRRVAATVADTSQPVASKKSLWKHVNADKQKCEHLEE